MNKSFLKSDLGLGEVVQQLRLPVAFPEDPGSIPRPHMAADGHL